MTEAKDTIALQCSHSSVRSFTSEPVSESDVGRILDAAVMASTSCGLQITSIIRIRDQAKKAKIAVLAGNQKHVAQAPEFWVFCIDYNRNEKLCGGTDLGWAEQLLVGCMDTGIMAQNVMVALESLGLGGVFIGGIRNGIREVSELLECPKNTMPLLGIAFGHPAVRNDVKPRLPKTVTVMIDRYCEPDMQEVARYDEEMRGYYRTRPANPKDMTWSDTLRPVLGKERRPFVLDYLHGQGFCLK